MTVTLDTESSFRENQAQRGEAREDEGTANMRGGGKRRNGSVIREGEEGDGARGRSP